MSKLKGTQEAYNALNEFTFLQDEFTPSEGHPPAYVVIAIVETDSTMAAGVMIVDPAIPSKGAHAELFKLNTPQHIAAAVSKKVAKMLDETAKQIQLMRKLASKIGTDRFIKLIKKADNADEFADELMEAIKKDIPDVAIMFAKR
jgi:uncharacterized protein YbaP (TraB family)